MGFDTATALYGVVIVIIAFVYSAIVETKLQKQIDEIKAKINRFG